VWFCVLWLSLFNLLLQRALMSPLRIWLATGQHQAKWLLTQMRRWNTAAAESMFLQAATEAR
jgi:hypothetical protein